MVTPDSPQAEAHPQLSMADLLERLGDETVAGGFSLGRSAKILAGKAWFDGWWSSAKDEVCSRGVDVFQGGEAETRLRDAAAIGDVFLGSFGHVPVATLSLIISRYGLERLCKEGFHPDV